jgi:parvulin-like peptidyl-prolyl isomerase
VINNWAYSAKLGDVSPVLKGTAGCYIAKLIDRRVPTDDQFKAVRQTMLRGLFQEREQRLMTQWITKQKEDATIVDYRVKH